MASDSRLVARRLAVVAGLLVGPGIVTTATPADAAYVPTAATVATYEARVIYQINVQRVKYARGKLAAGTCPDKYAEAWGSYLARTGSFYHQSLTPILRGCAAARLLVRVRTWPVATPPLMPQWLPGWLRRGTVQTSSTPV